MPCRDDGYADQVVLTRLHDLTAMLCGLCRRIVAAGRPDLIHVDAKLASWWIDHEAADVRRELAERAEAAASRLREVALAKLTSEERKALGL